MEGCWRAGPRWQCGFMNMWHSTVVSLPSPTWYNGLAQVPLGKLFMVASGLTTKTPILGYGVSKCLTVGSNFYPKRVASVGHVLLDQYLIPRWKWAFSLSGARPCKEKVTRAGNVPRTRRPSGEPLLSHLLAKTGLQTKVPDGCGPVRTQNVYEPSELRHLRIDEYEIRGPSKRIACKVRMSKQHRDHVRCYVADPKYIRNG